MENQEIQNELQSPHDLNLEPFHAAVSQIRAEMSKVLIGQKEMVDLLLAALFSNGHILLEGVPGIAKTTAAKSLARALELDFSRIQFTPDLMPADVTGTSVFNLKNQEFEFKRGPVFGNIVLIDEINRIQSKTKFNGSLDVSLSTAATTYSFQVGFNGGDAVSISLGQLNASGLKGAASATTIAGIASTTMAKTIEDASSTVTDIDAMLSNLNVNRATAGAVINRLEHTVSNLMNFVQRTEEARSRIEDADFAAESAALARANVLVQAGSAMLAQANQNPQFVLALLRQ